MKRARDLLSLSIRAGRPSRWAAAILICWAALGTSSAAAGVYDLAADWSDARNPNGPWQLRKDVGKAFEKNLEREPGQPAWVDGLAGENNNVPLWMKLKAPVAGFADAGTVVAHGAENGRTGSEFTSVAWTCPASATVTISGAVWLRKGDSRPGDREFAGRPMAWEIRRAGKALTKGVLKDDDRFDKDHPCNLATGFGGSGVLRLSVQVGEEIELFISRDGQNHWSSFVAVRLRIDDSGPPPLPELMRLATSDRVEDADGKQWLGRITNRQYELATSFGKVKVPAEGVAAVVRGTGVWPVPAGEDRISLILADGQVLVGKPADADLELTSAEGPAVRIAFARLRQAGYRLPDERTGGGPPGPLVILRSGDRLAWAPAADRAKPELELDLEFSKLPLSAGNIADVESLSPDGVRQRVRLANGSVLTGKLVPQKLKLKTPWGADLQLGWDQVQWLVGTSPAAPFGTVKVITSGDDRLSCELLTEELRIKESAGAWPVRTASIKSMTLTASGEATITLWDDQVVRGSLVDKAIKVRLGPRGPELSLPPDRVSALKQPEAVPPPELLAKIERLIIQLGSNSFEEREAATQELMKMHRGIAPILRRHLKDPDEEVRYRLEKILRSLG